MNDWQELGQLYAIRNAIEKRPLRAPGWFGRFSALRKLAAVAERFDAAHPEFVEYANYPAIS